MTRALVIWFSIFAGTTKEKLPLVRHTPRALLSKARGASRRRRASSQFPCDQMPEPGCLPHGTGRDYSLFMAWI